MKASVDSAKCTGHARCNAVAPQVFTVDADGLVVEYPQIARQVWSA